MTKLNKKTVLLGALMSLTLSAVGLAHYGKNALNHTTIGFSNGQDQLTQENKADLTKLIDTAKTSGQIDQVEVAVWSDEPFPARNEDLNSEDRTLADDRADQIEGYLKNSLGVSSVKTFNMAESSNWLARAFKTDTAELKSIFAKQEAPQMTRQDFNIIREDGAPGKAVVIVKRKMVPAAATTNAQ